MKRNETISYIAGAMQRVEGVQVPNPPENMPQSYKDAWTEGHAHLNSAIQGQIDHHLDVPTLEKTL